jgi:hypothetical protein
MNEDEGKIPPKDDIEKEIVQLEEKSVLVSKSDLKDYKKNMLWFLRFVLDVLQEKPEAESYAAFFLPALSMVFLLFVTLTVLFYRIFQTTGVQLFSSSLRVLAIALLCSSAGICGFFSGLRISGVFFKGSYSLQEISIVAGVFALPLICGFFLSWLFSYGTFVAGILILFLAHSTAIIAMYAVLPKTMLLKGLARFLTMIIALGAAILGMGIILRATI